MRKLAVLSLAALFAVGVSVPMSFVGFESSAYAAKKGKKDAAGKCGTMKYYDTKKKKCADASASKK